MSVPVHRCRFVQWSPSPITALAVPPHGSEFPPLAVGRQNGSIELYRWASTGPSPHAWVLQATLPGPADTKVDALAFTVRARRHPGQSRLRLFSLAGDANLFEWDIHSGSLRVRITPSTPQFTYVPPLSLYVPSPPILLIQSAISIVTNLNPAFSQHTIPSQGGTIWSLAPNPQGTLLALGCQDGAIRLLDISAETPVHLKRFDRVQTRFLSIAWAWPDPSLDAPDDSDDESDLVLDTTLVTGCSDSCVRTWDVRTGRVLNRMTVERARGERTLVWSVAVLGDGTIVSGDSLGAVKFWDNKTATQIQSFPAHNADVLCMTVSPTGDTVYTSGVDQRITEFVKLADKWIQTTQRRIHSHDVRALAMWPPYAPHNPTKPAYAPLLISAGLDMSVAILPTAPAHAESSSTLPNPLLGSNAPTFQDAYPRRVGYPVTSGPTFLAPIAKLVVSFHGRVVGVCKLPDQPTEGGEWEKLLEMELRFRTNITTGAISPDGKWLAVADVYEVKLFRIEDVKGTLHPRRSRTIASVLPPNSGASALGFTPDSRRLIVGTWSGAQVVLVDLDQGREEIVRTFELDNVERENDLDLDKNEDVTSGDPRVSRVAVSSDSQWLASADSAGRVNIFNLDSVKHVASLPRTGLPPSALVFDTHVPHVLALGYPSNNIQLFDAEAQAFYPALPDKLSHLHDPILGFAFPPTTSSTQRKLYVWSASYLARFDIATPSTSALVKSPPKAPTHRNEDGLKRKRGEQDEAFAIVTKFRPVLLVDFCASGEMVVVERPLVDLLATLPPAYLKPKYGAS